METLRHMLVECNGHDRERSLFIQGVVSLVGRESWEWIISREDEGLGCLLGFECEDRTINKRRVEVASMMKVFLTSVWRKRSQM